LRVANATIWRNSAPLGGGISTVETDFVPTVPPTLNPSVILRNTIVGGSLLGGSCDAMLTSEGGNIDTGIGCLLQDPRDHSNTDPGLEAIADNGGPTLTHALTAGGLAVDRGVEPCPATDQRGATRPQNSGCDVGAYEFE
jgi:large repetitive protein